MLIGYAHKDFASELTLLLQGEGGGGVKVGGRERGREGGMEGEWMDEIDGCCILFFPSQLDYSAFFSSSLPPALPPSLPPSPS